MLSRDHDLVVTSRRCSQSRGGAIEDLTIPPASRPVRTLALLIKIPGAVNFVDGPAIQRVQESSKDSCGSTQLET